MSKGVAHFWGHEKGEPWWRFVPRSTAVGVASVVVGFLLMVEALSSLFQDGNSAFGVLVEVLLALVALALIVQGVDGVRVLRRRRRSAWRR